MKEEPNQWLICNVRLLRSNLGGRQKVGWTNIEQAARSGCSEKERTPSGLCVSLHLARSPNKGPQPTAVHASLINSGLTGGGGWAIALGKIKTIMADPISWKQIAVVAFGGGFGSAARFWIATTAANYAHGSRFPVGTFLVNILGCLFVGLLWAANERWPFLTTSSRLLLFTGVAGGFTTFSAFGLETVLLLRRGDVAIAMLYTSLSIICGLSVLALSIWALRPSSQ